MSSPHYACLAPIRLKPGITEADLIAASEKFERSFVKAQGGILSRKLLRGKNGAYAGLVVFESKEAADKVMEAEMSSPDCMSFFAIMDAPDESAPDLGVLSFELVKTYEETWPKPSSMS
jgi:hypothetical protein